MVSVMISPLVLYLTLDHFVDVLFEFVVGFTLACMLVASQRRLRSTTSNLLIQRTINLLARLLLVARHQLLLRRKRLRLAPAVMR